MNRKRSWSRRLAAWRKRLRRSAENASLAGLYDRTLLFGGGAVLTLSILAAAIAGIAHRYTRCIDDWRAGFLAQRDFVNASVERNQARLRHTVETYEALSAVHERDIVPVDRYSRLLAQNGGIVVTGQDLGAAPFTIVSTLTAPEDRERLAGLLRLVREISPRSLLRRQEAADDIGGFLYTEDRRFLAAWPPLRNERLMGGAHVERTEAPTPAPGRNENESAAARPASDGIQALIDRYVAHVDAELGNHADALLRRDRVFWVTLHDSDMYGALVKHYAAPIYRGDERLAVLAVTLPARQIPRLFQPAVHDPDFFMVSRDRRHLIGIDESNPRGERWMHALAAKPSVFEVADERVRLVRRGGDFFIIQRIAGPEWIAVSAFDWRTIAANLKGPIGWTVALTSVVLAVQWAFVLLIDRFVLAPLRLRAQSVFESEAFSRTVLATAPVGLTVFDPATSRIVLQNDIARALLSASTDEAGFYARLLEPRPRRRRRARRGRRRATRAASGSGSRGARHNGLVDASSGSRPTSTGTIRSAEVSVTGADGMRRELAVAFARARYRLQEVVLCSLTDISRQKETVRLLRRARQAADEASRAKSMLVATISHELRTPLYGALGNLELLSMEALTPSQAARVGSVRRAFDSLLSLVDDVLDLSKAEARELSLHLEPFRLDEVVERCAQTLAPAITGKGLHFLCLIDPSIGGSWNGDGLRIAQIVTNLLGNACKFTQSGSITLRATVVQAAGGDEMVVLSVADSGIGIPASQLARIFEPFVQADGSIGRRFGGTGLGLSLSRRLVDLMGGRIDVKSVEGRGAVFAVRLPLSRNPTAKACAAAPIDETLEFDAIAVACDDAAWRATLLARLRHRFGGVARIEEARPDAPLAATDVRTLIVLGSHADDIPPAWRAALTAYADVVVVSERGPLHPQRRAGALHITSLCWAKLELALVACGRDGAVPGPETSRDTHSPPSCEHRGARILVVDDDPVSRALLADQLDALGYRQVAVAADGQEALAACQRHACDVVVADLCMPLMGGRELLAALRKEGMTMPVIAHTAAPHAAADARRSGFAALLMKPLSLERLREALDRVFASSQPALRVSPSSLPLSTPGFPSMNLLDAPHAGALKSRAAMLHAVFAASWPEDDERLCAAAKRGDTESFLQALHRVNGALLALGEREASRRCSALRDRVCAKGIAASAQALEAFRRGVARIAESGAAMMADDGEAAHE
ncbi:two-component system capsular synthesis sensor histidine kinase RcsC [Trinickia symbiotica]|uniref:Virulence sensor protein BvgS n=1 Tax=Trinickia symbiotica TaxID=863227 RepID=A0A2N7WS28_9BURK|nr:ATP-binding protein [Trinickia symbiotica]PMS32141.1 sensor histidine kinase [Trinickia symbiotica]PPK41937.1 two-component system capsular synthesis sensor histidine kinase RcsC [Trinickia symbiotica]